MKYVVIDIETTGIDPETSEILSIGAIVEDTNNILPYEELPKFHVAITHKEIRGSMFAINMNKELIAAIVHYNSAKSQDEKNDLANMYGMQFLDTDAAVDAFFLWLHDAGIVQSWNSETDGREYLNQHVRVINGKVYPMLSPKMNKVTITAAGKNFGTFDKKFLERLPLWNMCINVRSRIIDPAILYVDWKNDETLPGLEECKKRAELEGKVSHNALEDAWDTLQVLRKRY